MACAVACKDIMRLTPGPQKPLRMVNWETGTFPAVRLNFLMLHCFHCANPVCITAAVKSGNPGIYKEPTYGAVLIDPAYAANLRDAAAACPYGAFAYASDDPTAPAVKCDMCIARLQQGRKPVCVMACNMRALDFDTMANLKTKYGSVAASNLTGLPDPSVASPSLIVKQADPKQQLVPYDTSRVLQIWPTRGTLPPVYTDPTLITPQSANVIGRSKPVINPKDVAEVITSSRSDDG
jgi:anaerobic dimethyl sulfoxide reductase subunit B